MCSAETVEESVGVLLTKNEWCKNSRDVLNSIYCLSSLLKQPFRASYNAYT